MSKKDAPKLIKLPRIQKELTQCQMCGYCIDVCEAHRQSPWESVTARGKIYYLNQLDKAGTGAMDKLLGRKATLSPEFVDAMFKCTGCGNCEAVCHAKIELVALWEKIRKWMADQGVAPLPVHRKLEGSIVKNGNPYGEPKSKRDAWWPADVERVTPPQAVFFAGCTGSYRMQNIPQAAVRVLSRAGVTLNCLGEHEICCTSPLLRTGITLRTLEASKETVSKGDALGAKDMIMSCSGCYKTVSSNFVEYYGKPGQNVYHITQYVDKLISERKLPLNNEFKAKVTYHDPCHLGRHSKVYEEPRNILKKIKGIDFVEMEKNRENSRCCGAGGGYKSAFNDFAVNIAAERIRDAEAVGAEIIATACPFCVLNLKHGAKKIGSKVKVMDITEILLDVTGPKKVEPEPVVEEPKVVEVVKEVEVIKEVEIVKEVAKDLTLLGSLYEYTKKQNVANVVADKYDDMKWWYFTDKIEAVMDSDADDDAKIAGLNAIIAEMAACTPADKAAAIYAYAEAMNQSNVAAGKYDEKRAAAFSAQIDEVKNSGMDLDAKRLAMAQIIGGMVSVFGVAIAAEALSDEKAPAANDMYAYAEAKNQANVEAGKYDKKRAVAFSAQIAAIRDSDMDDDAKTIAMAQLIGGMISVFGVAAAAEEAPAKAAPATDMYAYAEAKNQANVEAGKYDKKRAVAFSAQIAAIRDSDMDDDAKTIAMAQLIGGMISVFGVAAAVAAAPAEESELEKTYKLAKKVNVDQVKAEAYDDMKWWYFTDKIEAVMASEDSDDKKVAALNAIIAEMLAIKAVAAEVDDVEDAAEDGDEFEYMEFETTPEGIVRRAAWNKGLRCRRNYGEDNIQVAFVKSKIAVFVTETGAYEDVDKKLKNEGWTVLRYKEEDITDGQEQAAEIKAKAKENLRASKKKKKKKKA